MPWLNQLVMMCSATPEPNSRSPSLEMMLREQDSSSCGRRGSSAQIIAIGVRDMVLPPMPTEAPSLHERRRLLERHDLLAQAAVASRQILRSSCTV